MEVRCDCALVSGGTHRDIQGCESVSILTIALEMM